MTLTYVDTILLLSIISLGSFIQALTGFALGLIILALTMLFGLTSPSFTTAVITVVMLVQCSWLLRRNRSEIDTRLAVRLAVGTIPGVATGLVLLGYLDDTAPAALRALLAATILLSALVLGFNLFPAVAPRSSRSALVAGFLGGVTGGLFASPGPPIVFYLYRLSLPAPVTRSTLISVFLACTAWRAVYTAIEGTLDWKAATVAVAASPFVLGAAHLGARITTHVSSAAMRRLAAILLIPTALMLFLGGR